MTLRPTLAGPSDLLWKLEREHRRAIQHDHPLHKAEHFYNFCVTAWSMADYLKKAGKADFPRWLAVPEIVAAKDVANTVKHFTLNPSARTSAVTPGVSPVVRFHETPEGDLVQFPDEKAPSLRVKMKAGEEYEMWEFMATVRNFWRDELARLGIACPEQSRDDAHGLTDKPPARP